LNVSRDCVKYLLSPKIVAVKASCATLGVTMASCSGVGMRAATASSASMFCRQTQQHGHAFATALIVPVTLSPVLDKVEHVGAGVPDGYNTVGRPMGCNPCMQLVWLTWSQHLMPGSALLMFVFNVDVHTPSCPLYLAADPL